MNRRRILLSMVGLLAALLLITGLSATAMAEAPLTLKGEIKYPNYILKGSPVKITLPQAQNATSYTAAFRNVENNWIPVNQVSGSYAAGEVSIPTTGLTAGLWPLRVTISGPNDQKLYWERVINVVTSAPSSTGITYKLSNNNLPLNKAGMLWAYAPGATGIVVQLGELGSWHSPGEYFDTVFGFDNDASFNFTIKAYYPDGTIKTKGPIAFQTAAKSGTLAKPTVTISKTITASKGLDVTFNKVTAGSANVRYQVRVWQTDGELLKTITYKNTLENGDAEDPEVEQIAGSSQTFHMDASKFKKGCSYGVSVYTSADGYASDNTYVEQIVPYATAQTGNGLRLLVNGSDASTASVQTHERFFVKVELPQNATAARLFRGGDFEYLNDEEDWDELMQRGYWSARWEDGYPGKYPLYAQVYTGEIGEGQRLEDLNWGNATSNIVTLTVVAVGDTKADQTTLSVPATVERGQDLVLSNITYGNNVKSLWYNVQAAGGREFEGYIVDNPQAQAVYPTGGLKPGLYRLNINGIANESGLREYEGCYYFVVTEPTQAQDFYFSVSNTNPLAHEDIFISAYAPGASRVQLCIDDSREDETEVWDYWGDGDSFGCSMERNEGNYVLYAMAFYDGDDPHWAESEHVTVKVRRSGQELPEEYELEAPSLIQAGQNYVFTVRNLDQAEDWWWQIELQRELSGEERERLDRDWTTVWRTSASETTASANEQFEIPSSVLQAGCRYELSVWADAKYYGGRGLHQKFFVYGAEDDNLHLTVSYGGQSSTSALTAPVRAEITLSVDAPDNATALRIYDGNDWDYRDELEDGHDEWRERLDSDNTLFFVSACYDEIDKDWEDLNWQGISNVVHMTVTSDGEAADANVTVDLDGDTITRGELVGVSIAAGSAQNYGTDFNAYFRDASGEDYRWADWDVRDADLPLSFALQTMELPEGEDYYLIVESSRLGYDWHETAIGPFSVVEPQMADGDVLLTLSDIAYPSDECDHYFIIADDRFVYSAYSSNPETDHIEVIWSALDLEPGDDWECDPWSFGGRLAVGDREEGREGLYTIQAVAYDEDDREIAHSAVYTVEVGVYGDLDAPVIVSDGRATAGKAYTFTVNGLYQREDGWWDIAVYDEDSQNEDGSWLCVFEDCSGNHDDGQFKTFKIPNGKLESGHMYQIRVHVDAHGYHSNEAELQLYAYNAVDGDFIVTVNGKQDATSGYAHKEDDFEIAISAPGASLVRLYGNNGWDYLGDFNAETYTFRRMGYWFDSGVHKVFAQACYDPISEETWQGICDGSIPWESMNWGKVSSNVVTVTVNDKGKASKALLDSGEYTVTRGELLHFRILAGENIASRSTNFNANIVDDDWNPQGNDFNVRIDKDVTFPIDAYLNTGNLDPNGSYWLIVNSCAPMYDWDQIRVPVKVVEPGSGAQTPFIFRVEDNLFVDVDFMFSAYEPNASWMDVIAHNVEDDDDHEYDVYWDGYPGNFVDGRGSLGAGTYEMWAVAHYANENGEEVGEPRLSEVLTVAVGYYGVLEAPVFEGAEFVSANADYTFTVPNLHQTGDNWYDISVFDDDYDWSQGDSNELCRFKRDEYGDVTTAFTVPKEKLVPGRRYRVSAWVDDNGYEGLGSDFYFFTCEGSNKNLVVKVNGKTDKASGDAHKDEDFTITVNVPSTAKALRIYGNNGWDYLDVNDVVNGVYTRNGYWFDPGVHRVFAQICTAEINWNDIGNGTTRWEDLPWGPVSKNTVVVTVQALEPTCGAELDRNAYTVTRGELLHFRITGGGPEDMPGHVTHFHAYIIDEYGNWDGSNDASPVVGSADDFPLDVYLTTGYLSSEGRNWLVVDSCAPGYEWGQIRVPLTVVEPEEEAPFIFDVQYDPLWDQDFRFSAYEPNASWIDVVAHNVEDGENHDNDAHWDGYPGNHVNGRGCLGAGAYKIWAVAHYADGEGVEIGETRDSAVLDLVVYEETLPSASQSWPRIVWKGENIRFSFEAVDGADRYTAGQVGEDGYAVQPGECTLTNSNQLASGQVYFMGVDAWSDTGLRPGYSTGHAVAVVDPSKVLVLPSAIREIDDEAFMGVDAEMIVLPDGVTSIGKRAFANCPNLVALISPIDVPASAIKGCKSELVIDTEMPAGR